MADQPNFAEAKARILQLRRRLLSTSSVTFSSQPGSRSQSHWSGAGQGRVEVVTAEDGSLALHEHGYFQLDTSPGASRPAAPVAFRNVFRWRFAENHVTLSHERRGQDAAVWLFDLVMNDAVKDADLVSRDPHLCVDDRYRAQLTFADTGFDLTWTITGPRKDEFIHYRYRAS
ncbi:MAG: DUF6314 family protein [Halomonas sp.]|nr:DUF6314 family protein [Halomonas sp.]